jgi:hypothetical protein
VVEGVYDQVEEGGIDAFDTVGIVGSRLRSLLVLDGIARDSLILRVDDLRDPFRPRTKSEEVVAVGEAMSAQDILAEARSFRKT